MALFLLGARDTRVPILHYKAAGETNILVGSSFNKVCVLQAGWLVILDSGRNVHAHLDCHHLCHPCTVGNAAGRVVGPSAGTAAVILEGEGEKDVWGGGNVGPCHYCKGGVCG